MENVAVVGASPKEDRYSNKAIKMLDEYNHNPIPVAPRYKTIEGKPVYESVSDIKEPVDTVTMYVGPARQAPVIDQILELRPKRVIFNPDTENREAADKLKAAGIDVVEACTLVLLKTNQY
jgi:predicted CoA-binding protein